MQETWRIGVDIGGTFTDLVLVGSQSGIRLSKVPSTPDDPARGVFDGLAKAAEDIGQSVEGLLGACTHFVHGTTIATNTLLEGKGVKTGMIVTHGFRDSIEIRRGLRDNVWDHRSPWPEVLVPRHLRRPVRERTTKTGAIETEAVVEDLDDAIARFRAADVRAVAVCLINSYLNPRNETVCADYLCERMPGCFIYESARLAAVMGEYERSSTAVVNAFIGPRVVPYLNALDGKLRAMGMPGRLLLIQSNGGAVQVDHIEDKPVALMLSGPAAGVGALDFYARAGGLGDLISMEVGGTSCDVMLFKDGKVAETTRLDIAGYPAITPSVEINTVGTGGGTIAQVDAGGMLKVGPQGAGSRPGPASYGLGGTLPTVTDAQLVLGRLRTGAYAGGSLSLDIDLARQAIEEHVAQPLGMSVEDAAIGIIRLADQNMVHALEQISSEKGSNPGGLTLVACGGAGALHGSAVARLLGCPRVFVPNLAGVFCAFGMCNSDIRHDVIQSYFAELATVSIDDIRQVFAAREDELRQVLRAEGFADDAIACDYFLHAKYRGQQWTVQVAVDPEDDGIAAVKARFERQFSDIYGYAQPDGTVEVVSLQLVMRGRLPQVEVVPRPPTDTAPQPYQIREVWTDAAHGLAPVPIFRASDLLPGHRIAGPAIVEEDTTTILVGVGDVLSIDPMGNYSIAVSGTGSLLQ